MSDAQYERDSDEEIQSHGANARARGESMFENPYLHPPHSTADRQLSEEEWLRRMHMWELGWRMEDLIRIGAGRVRIG